MSVVQDAGYRDAIAGADVEGAVGAIEGGGPRSLIAHEQLRFTRRAGGDADQQFGIRVHTTCRFLGFPCGGGPLDPRRSEDGNGRHAPFPPERGNGPHNPFGPENGNGRHVPFRPEHDTCRLDLLGFQRDCGVDGPVEPQSPQSPVLGWHGDDRPRLCELEHSSQLIGQQVSVQENDTHTGAHGRDHDNERFDIRGGQHRNPAHTV
jgi:hypothetical protein